MLRFDEFIVRGAGRLSNLALLRFPESSVDHARRAYAANSSNGGSDDVGGLIFLLAIFIAGVLAAMTSVLAAMTISVASPAYAASDCPPDCYPHPS
jgi:hypothetical protein